MKTKPKPATPLPHYVRLAKDMVEDVERRGEVAALIYGKSKVAMAKLLVKYHSDRARLVETLRDLAPLLDQVPVFQLDDGKASVKAIRLAGKFMDATRAAKALLRELGEAS